MQVLQTSFKFITASTNKTTGVFNRYQTIYADEMARFITDPVVDKNTAGAYQSTRQLDSFRKCPFNEQKIESLLFLPPQKSCSYNFPSRSFA